jgi:hypothetical protein
VSTKNSTTTGGRGPADDRLRLLAREFHALGYNVIAVGSDKTARHPWKHWQTKRQTLSELDALPWGDAMAVGLVNGIGLLRSVDLDPHKDGPKAGQPVPLEVVTTFLRACGLDPVTYPWLERSQSGNGYHLWLGCEGRIGPELLGESNRDPGVFIGTCRDGSYHQVELRWERSLTVCAATADPTRWVNGPPTAAPAALEVKAVLKAFRRIAEPKPPNPKQGSATKGSEEADGRPGADFNRGGDIRPVLQEAGWLLLDEQDGVGYWRRPGKTDGQHSATTDFVPGLFYVFSSNAAPFEANRSYTKFAVYALLKHGGDFAAAAKDLTEQGYGAPPRSAASWPAPLREEALHGLAGDVVRALDPHTEADPAAILLNVLVMAGSAIGATPHARVGQARHGVNLFVVQVGETAKGRKGTGLSGPRHLVREADPEWRGRLVSGLSSGEGVIHAVRDPLEKQEPIKEKVNGRQEVTGYQTVVVDSGAEDKRLLVLEEEFASTLKVAGREGNTLSPVLRQAWDGEDLQILTKNSPERATAPHVAVIGHVTKDELLRYLDSTEGANGFANRFLWVCVKRSKVLPEGGEVPGAILEELTQRLIEVIEFARTAAEISRDKEAKALWAEIYPELSEGKPGLFGAVTARAEAQVLRLSALYALLDRSAVIRVEHLLAALAVCDYCEVSARFIFGDAVGNPIADRILSTLRTEGSKSQTDLSALFGRHIEANRIDRALETLLRAGLVTSERQETEGRTKTIWHAA